MDEYAYVYILSGDSKCLYIGLTTTLAARVQQHKNKAFPDSFTAKYNIHRLVYYERFGNIHSAIEREKQLKKWNRLKKVALIVSLNPDWRNLSEEWGKPMEPFNGKLRPPETFG